MRYIKIENREQAEAIDWLEFGTALKEAQKYPEKYRDLLVRVAGCSAYFVELEKIVQDEIIARTTQMTFS